MRPSSFPARLLVTMALLAVALSGCLADTQSTEQPPTTTGAPGDSGNPLGTLYLQHDEGTFWMGDTMSKSEDVVVTLTPATPSHTFRFTLEDKPSEAIATAGFGMVNVAWSDSGIVASGGRQWESRLLINDQQTASQTSDDGTMSMELPESIPAGANVALELTVTHDAAVAQALTLHLDGSSWLQIPGPGQAISGAFVQGGVTITQDGSRVKASRSDVLVLPEAKPQGGDLSLRTVNGYIEVSGTDEDAVVVAELSAWGSSEQQARDRLATLYVQSEHDDDSFSFSATVMTTDTGDRRWSDKAGNLRMDLPQATLALAQLDTVNGPITWRGLNAEGANFDTTNGAIEASDAMFNDLSADTTNGAIQMTLGAPTASGDYTLDATNGALDLTVSQTGDHGVDVRGETTNGDVTFRFDNTEPVGEQDDNDKHERTTGYNTKGVQTAIVLDTTNGAIDAGD